MTKTAETEYASLAERLKYATIYDGGGEAEDIGEVAADAIEKLLAENARLREALDKAKLRLAAIGQMHSIDDGPAVQLKRCLKEGQQGYIEASAALNGNSDGLKRAALRSRKLPEHEIAAWFFNASDGPQYALQPLYLTPACEGQRPVAALAREFGGIICAIENKSIYRPDVEWIDLYLARALHRDPQ